MNQRSNNQTFIIPEEIREKWRKKIKEIKSIWAGETFVFRLKETTEWINVKKTKPSILDKKDKDKSLKAFTGENKYYVKEQLPDWQHYSHQ